jgi:hypothetical protein
MEVEGRRGKFLFLWDGRWKMEMGEVLLVLARWEYEVSQACKGEFLKRKKFFISIAGSSPYSNSMMDINNSCIIQSMNSPFRD